MGAGLCRQRADEENFWSGLENQNAWSIILVLLKLLNHSFARSHPPGGSVVFGQGGGVRGGAAAGGGLLFGSRAVTETILVLGSPYGDEHFVSAILQAAIALACAAYFFLVK